MNQQDVAQLRYVLSILYETESKARRIVDDAGVNSSRISFGGESVQNWHEILSEASKQDKLQEILSVALEEYSHNKELLKISNRYLGIHLSNENLLFSKKLQTPILVVLVLLLFFLAFFSLFSRLPSQSSELENSLIELISTADTQAVLLNMEMHAVPNAESKLKEFNDLHKRLVDALENQNLAASQMLFGQIAIVVKELTEIKYSKLDSGSPPLLVAAQIQPHPLEKTKVISGTLFFPADARQVSLPVTITIDSTRIFSVYTPFKSSLQITTSSWYSVSWNSVSWNSPPLLTMTLYVITNSYTNYEEDLTHTENASVISRWLVTNNWTTKDVTYTSAIDNAIDILKELLEEKNSRGYSSQ